MCSDIILPAAFSKLRQQPWLYLLKAHNVSLLNLCLFNYCSPIYQFNDRSKKAYLNPKSSGLHLDFLMRNISASTAEFSLE